MRILLVDDEEELAEPLQRILTNQKYVVDVANSGDRGWELAQKGGYDLLILDWMMPEKSWVEICSQLRQRGDSTPVLILTAKDTLDDRVAGLDSGADDYLVKPFELRELLARVRALLVLEQARKPMTIKEMFEQSPDSLNNRSTVLRVVRDLQDGGLCSVSEIDGVEIIEALRNAT